MKVVSIHILDLDYLLHVKALIWIRSGLKDPCKRGIYMLNKWSGCFSVTYKFTIVYIMLYAYKCVMISYLGRVRSVMVQRRADKIVTE